MEFQALQQPALTILRITAIYDIIYMRNHDITFTLTSTAPVQTARSVSHGVTHLYLCFLAIYKQTCFVVCPPAS
jgi:hypothetical protein